ncbi:protein O-mannosyl-transferase family [Chryseobacterium paridis]|uniref:Glycosyltransferase family 39 protein n=1 Tax=Chryseobacterium paridis TaxID=2800328 RepID=A0ABS1FPP6_9FLAO|nr:glycosyltransferase family 39 protein [Chryseobacterium paridis]MBK1894392.1 glycosyltransferase family 39 protein [Chryseobacterium paridis]
MNKKYTLQLLSSILFLLIIYIFSVAKDPSLGDSIVFTVQGYNGFEFDSNATNHLLFSNVLAFLHKILPFINVHFLFVGVSIICSLLFLFYLKKLLEIVGVSPRSSLICILLLGLSFTFWRQSIITEVYTFYLLFVALFLINLFKFIQDKRPKYFYYLSFFFGLLFLIHIQSILFIPIYFYFLFKNFKHLKKHCIYGIWIVFFLCSILLIPPFLGHHTFGAILSNPDYTDSVFNLDIKIILKSIVKNSGILIYNFLYFIIFLFWGLRNKKFLDYIAIGALPFFAFCIKHNVSDIHVFHLVPYIFILIFIGRGLDYFPKLYILLPILLPFFYFLTFKVIEKTSIGQQIEKEKGYKGGTRYMLFPPLNKNPDLNYFILKYKEDSLYRDPALKSLYPDVIKWESIKDEYMRK